MGGLLGLLCACITVAVLLGAIAAISALGNKLRRYRTQSKS